MSSYEIDSELLSAKRLASVQYLSNPLGQRVFKTEPSTPRQDPSADQLGADYTAWLRKNFAWLFNQQNSNNSRLGTAYVYGDAELGQHSLLGEYGNGDAKGKGRTEYIWLPTQGGNSIPVGMYRNGKFFAIHADHLGTPRLITDEDNTPVWQWAYSAFGDNKPTGVLKATHNPKQAITITPTSLRNTTPIEMNLRMPGQYFDEESGLLYNYFRNYNSAQGRYTQSDPIGLDGGLNRYSYADGAPTMFTDPLGLYTEVVVWQGVGIGSSSFGHVSTNVNGKNFSWGPGGWDKQSATAAEYNKRQQDFRGGTGVMLNLSPQQEAALASCMRASTAAYSAISNNCGNPVQQCLNVVGAGVGNSVLPSSILENLRSSPNSNGNVSYPSPRPGSSFGGGLVWR